MDNNATLKLVLDPKISDGAPRTIKLRVTFQRDWRLFSVGGKNKYTAARFDDLNKRLKEYKEEIDSIEAKSAPQRLSSKNWGQTLPLRRSRRDTTSAPLAKNSTPRKKKSAQQT